VYDPNTQSFVDVNAFTGHGESGVIGLEAEQVGAGLVKNSKTRYAK